MADNVLYFPSIRVPETEWFTRVLLYWDTVGTIVPSEYMDDPKFLRPYTAGLMEHGLLKAVMPDSSALWEGGEPKYRDAFLALMNSLHLKRRKVSLHGLETVRIHLDKTGHGLASELVARNLAARISGPEWGTWFEVEKQAGNLLMAFLATILGQRSGQRMDPITDSADCLKAFASVPIGAGVVEGRLDPIRTEILADLLPAPVDLVPPAQLAHFKDQYGELLKGFRAAVEQRVVAAAGIENPELRSHQIGLIKTELKAQLEEITRRMQEHTWNRISFGTLLAVIAAGIVVADALITGGQLTIAGASLGLTSAVYTAYDGTRTPQDLLARPMAYAALAHRKLGAA
jgi:hypothetical protein